MKVELVKETKWNGDIFFFIQQDGERVGSSTVFAGTTQDPIERINISQQRASELLRQYCQDHKPIEIIETIEL